MADNTELIAHYREILAAGSEMVSVDGLTDRKDLGEIQRLLNEAIRNDDATLADPRPVLQRLPLDNSW